MISANFVQYSKVESSMLVTPGGIAMDTKFAQPSNTQISSAVILIGIEIEVNATQFKNAFVPMDSKYFGNTTVDSFEQYAKTDAPMCLMLRGMVIEVNSLHRKNAESEISVIVSGSVTLLSTQQS